MRAWTGEKVNLCAVIARVRTFPGMRSSRATHRLAISPVCWGISDVPGWGHQLDPERVLSEAAAVGEGAITAGPPRGPSHPTPPPPPAPHTTPPRRVARLRAPHPP